MLASNLLLSHCQNANSIKSILKLLHMVKLILARISEIPFLNEAMASDVVKCCKHVFVHALVVVHSVGRPVLARRCTNWPYLTSSSLQQSPSLWSFPESMSLSPQMWIICVCVQKCDYIKAFWDILALYMLILWCFIVSFGSIFQPFPS